MERIVAPALIRFRPDVIIVACGFDAALIDPLSRMMATSETFRLMTRQIQALADDLCGGKLVLVHEGGYSEVYVPFCGHAVIEEMSGSAIRAGDPFAETFEARQPREEFSAFLTQSIDKLAAFHG